LSVPLSVLPVVLGPNLQNFVRRTYENVTSKESDIRKVYEENPIFRKKTILRKIRKIRTKKEKNVYDSLLADLGKRQTCMQ